VFALVAVVLLLLLFNIFEVPLMLFVVTMEDSIAQVYM
jgi:hypothetical protein